MTAPGVSIEVAAKGARIIIQGMFNLTLELADDVIGWVGGVGRSSIGKDTEGKVHQMFMVGGRFGSSAAQNMGPKMPGGGGGKGGGGPTPRSPVDRKIN